MDPSHLDELNRIIDRGLTSYVAHEPLAGLEDRVLARVRLANSGSRRAAWRYWAFAVPALATLILIAFLPRSSRGPVPDPVQPSLARLEKAPPPPPRLATHRAIRQRVAERPSPLPKRNQFPTPTPLTPEERALIAVAQLQPAGLESVSQFPANPEEIRIKPIEIPPLQIDSNE